MAEVEFQYEGIKTVIQCTEDQKMSDICNLFISKSGKKENEIYYSYDGKSGSQFDQNLIFKEMANSLDKARKKMNVLVANINKDKNNNSIIKSKYVICPKCNESIKLKIDNFKINLFGCKK